MSRFYTTTEAAAAIAALIQPEDEALRTDAAQRYHAKLYDDLCDGRLVGRWPDTRLSIEHPNMRLPSEYRNLAGAIALSGCVISEKDLDAWLAVLGVNVELAAMSSLPIKAENSAAPSSPSFVHSTLTGPERDAAMLAAHGRYRLEGKRDFLALVARDFEVSVSTIKKCLRRARASRSSASTSGGVDWGRQFNSLMQPGGDEP